MLKRFSFLLLAALLGLSKAQNFNDATEEGKVAWVENDFVFVPSDGAAGDFFGAAIAADLNYTLITATQPLDAGTGKAYVFTRVRVNESESGPDDTWNETAIITANDAAVGDSFGYSVAVLEDIAVIGAPDKDGTELSSGAVYVFERLNDTVGWEQKQKIEPQVPLENGRFGISVGYDGESIVVGSPFEAAGGNGRGAAYVYKFDNETDTFVLDTQILSNFPQNGGQFGFSVSARNNTIAIGAPGANAGGAGGSGTVEIFRKKNDTGEWIYEDRLVPDGLGGGDAYGSVVYLDFTRVLASAPAYNGPVGGSGGGFAFDYNTTLKDWNQTGVFAPSGPITITGGDNIGSSMVVQASFLAVGASNLEGDRGADSGAAFTYYFNQTEEDWKPLAILLPDAVQAGDLFGYSLGLFCESLFVGAPGDINAGGTDKVGTVYWYNKNFNDTGKCVEEPAPIRSCQSWRPFCDPLECKRWQIFCRLRQRVFGPPDDLPEPKTCPAVFDPCSPDAGESGEEEEDNGWIFPIFPRDGGDA